MRVSDYLGYVATSSDEKLLLLLFTRLLLLALLEFCCVRLRLFIFGFVEAAIVSSLQQFNTH